MNGVEEVAADIFMVAQSIGLKGFGKTSANIFVVAGKDGLIFDSGYGFKKAGAELVETITEISSLVKERSGVCNISRAMISHGHWDHFSGLNHLQKSFDLEVYATPKQIRKIKSKNAYKTHYLKENSNVKLLRSKFLKSTFFKFQKRIFIELLVAVVKVNFVFGEIKIIDENLKFQINRENWQIIHVPGHSDDDIALYNKKRGILLAGDLLLRSITTWLGPPDSDLRIYFESLESLLDLPNLKLILPAHGSPITNPEKRIKEAIDHRKNRTEEIVQILKASSTGLSFKQIYKKIYPREALYQKMLLSGWIQITLEYLCEQGIVTLTSNGRKIVYSIREEV